MNKQRVLIVDDETGSRRGLSELVASWGYETEAAIQRSMDQIIVGRTTIVIAHRLSTVRNADRIFVLENGQLSESGLHDELVESGGIYENLWKVQTGDREWIK